MPIRHVIEEIEKNTGSQFDPEIAKHFIDLLESSILSGLD